MGCVMKIALGRAFVELLHDCSTIGKSGVFIITVLVFYVLIDFFMTADGILNKIGNRNGFLNLCET